ncbi:hypothetical protein TNCV_3037561 [Trichonephila clavipes]|nr:hypothetical protein TNCV_3037561 [Trichonephila clavipes]
MHQWRKIPCLPTERLPGVTEGILATTHEKCDSCMVVLPLHFLIAVPSHLNATHTGMWIEYSEPVAKSPYLLDLNPLDFFFWDIAKLLVYETPVVTLDIFTARIVISFDNQLTGFVCPRPTFLFLRCRLCYDYAVDTSSNSCKSLVVVFLASIFNLLIPL